MAKQESFFSRWGGMITLGLIGLGGIYMLGKLQESIVDKAFGGLWSGIFGTGDDPISYDIHGCPVGVSTWCASLGHCVPIGLTCPTGTVKNDPYHPTTDPAGCTPGMSWCEKQGHCVADYIITPSYCDPSYVPPWQQPTDDPVYIPGQVDVCYWPNGDPLTVPPGKDCQEAVDDMCYRFRSIPGYKGCS